MNCSQHTFLKYLGSVHLDQAQVGVLVLLAVAHIGRCVGGGLVVRCPAWLQAQHWDNHHVDTLEAQGWGVSYHVIPHLVWATLCTQAMNEWWRSGFVKLHVMWHYCSQATCAAFI